eukprot:3605480-Prymnesium_polylepis.2
MRARGHRCREFAPHQSRRQCAGNSEASLGRPMLCPSAPARHRGLGVRHGTRIDYRRAGRLATRREQLSRAAELPSGAAEAHLALRSTPRPSAHKALEFAVVNDDAFRPVAVSWPFVILRWFDHQHYIPSCGPCAALVEGQLDGRRYAAWALIIRVAQLEAHYACASVVAWSGNLTQVAEKVRPGRPHVEVVTAHLPRVHLMLPEAAPRKR